MSPIRKIIKLILILSLMVLIVIFPLESETVRIILIFVISTTWALNNIIWGLNNIEPIIKSILILSLTVLIATLSYWGYHYYYDTARLNAQFDRTAEESSSHTIVLTTPGVTQIKGKLVDLPPISWFGEDGLSHYLAVGLEKDLAQLTNDYGIRLRADLSSANYPLEKGSEIIPTGVGADFAGFVHILKPEIEKYPLP